MKCIKHDYSVREVAEILGISTKEVRARIKDWRKGKPGGLEAYRPGKRNFRVTDEALESFRAMRTFQLKRELAGAEEDVE